MEERKHRQPMISVIMGVYNCENTVSEAIESVLAQTYQDFELIICDDGSLDSTYEIVTKYAEKHPDQIVFIKNDRNRGLNYTLNHCLRHASGRFIARMDGDDLSLPERFEKEIAYFEKHPRISILGASLRVFDDEGVWGTHTFKEYPQPFDFVHGTPFSHSVCMVRKEAYDVVEGYSESNFLLRVEDYHLWTKMYSKGFRGANLSDELYLYRDDRAGYQKRKYRYRLNEAYVTFYAIKTLGLPKWCYVYALKPLLVGILPYRIYHLLHKQKMSVGRS